MELKTEYEFILPRGYVDKDGNHKSEKDFRKTGDGWWDQAGKFKQELNKKRVFYRLLSMFDDAHRCSLRIVCLYRKIESG